MVAFTTRPELQGSFGMVASTHYLGSAAGMAVLEAGGNAVDAAVATGFTLQVVEPHLNGPGGDMSLIFAPQGGPPVVLCGQGPAPAAATVEAFSELGLAEIPGSGPLATAIPGSTVAWLSLLRDHGTFPLDAVLGYAIHYAEHGFPVLPSITNTVTAVAELLAGEWTTSAAHYLASGRPPQPGEFLTNPQQAGTYRRLLEAAAGRSREAGIDAALAAWREGFVAESVDAFCRSAWMDSSGQRHSGLLTGDDMAGWEPAYEQPATAEFGGLTIAKTGPWGQGPVLLQQLRMLDGLDLQVGTAEFVHTVVEIAKLAFADRNAYYGDGGDVPLAELLSAPYAEARRALIGDTASMEMRPGSPGGRTPVLPDYPGAGATVLAGTAGEPTVPAAGDRSGPAAAAQGATAREAAAGTVGRPTGRYGGPVGEPVPDPDGRTRGDTCHIDVVDRWGTMVSATPSGGWLQSSPIIPELGFPLGTRLQMLSLQPGLPTTLAPGRRPRTTLSPSMAVAGDRTVLAFGTPGGDQQDQWQIPFLLAHLVSGMNLQEAIDAPSFHTTHFASSFHPHEAHPGQIVVEDRFDPEMIEELRRRGHEVVLSDPWSLGRLSAVSREPETGIMRAGANPRGMQGYAIGR